MVGSVSGSAGASSYSPYLGGGTAALRAQNASAGGQSGSGSRSGGTAQTSTTGKPLTPADQQLIAKLQTRDADVKAHEQAHRTAAGQYAGSPSYTYQKGPDGANYAIGGEVSIDTSPIPNNPSATIAKLARVQAAALAPADPSGQDMKVAAEAAQAISQAEAGKTNGTGPDQGANQSGAGPNSGGAGSGAGAGSGSAATAATTAAANTRNAGNGAAATRGLAAYKAAAGLGALASPSSRLSVYA